MRARVHPSSLHESLDCSSGRLATQSSSDGSLFARFRAVPQVRPTPVISPSDSAAVEGCLIAMILSPTVWVFLEFAFISLVIAGIVAGLGAHPVIAIVSGLATMIALHAWLRARWAGLVLLSILTAFWSILGGALGWWLSPKSRTQLEWLRGHRLLTDESLERRIAGALREADPLWDAFLTIIGALLVGGVAHLIHRSVRDRRLMEVSEPGDTIDP